VTEPIVILNVDDVESVRYAKTRTLQTAGFKVEEAATGQEALDKVRVLRPELVLLDVRLPDISGIEVCRQIRRDNPMTLILHISASYTSADDRVLGLESGADSYLVQPIEPAELIAAVRALLRIRTAEEKLRRLNESLEARVSERTRQLVEANQRLTYEIAEREKAEASLIQSQKSEAMGQLTGGIAHDFNNLLMVILSNLHLLQKRLPDDDKSRRYFDGAMHGAERGVTLTQRLLAFARKQELTAQTVDLSRLVNGLRDMIERSIGPMIKISIDAPAGLPPAFIDPNQLELAIVNLAVNARDAMEERGQLSISVSKCTWAGSESLTAGDYLRLRVQDTGRGMDQETLNRSIEPFFSTKGVGKGTGLGLAMVHGFLLQSGGALGLSSEVGKGTTADLWIPISGEEIGRSDTTAKPTVPQGSLKVLVVDDEPLLTMTTAEILKELGHQPLEAASAAEALAALEEHGDIDLMITDHAMPGMSGAELARVVRQKHPRLHVILATGYNNLPEGTEVSIERLPKPYYEHDLSAAISRIVARKSR
jgi:signal transduction histidine kinase